MLRFTRRLQRDVACRRLREVDPRIDDPKRRPFAPGFPETVAGRRAILLWAALTPLALGPPKRPSLAQATVSIRDPLLALGCPDRWRSSRPATPSARDGSPLRCAPATTTADRNGEPSLLGGHSPDVR